MSSSSFPIPSPKDTDTMSGGFYIQALTHGDNVLVRAINNDGEAVNYRQKYSPTLFVPSKTKNTKHKTIWEDPVEPLTFNTMKEARDFVRKYDDVDGFRLYGCTQFVYPFISDNWKGLVEYDSSKVKVAVLDIEVQCEGGFASVDNPSEEVNAITLYDRNEKTFHVFGIGAFKTKRKDIRYYDCASESHLLSEFLSTWKSINPHVVTGWNVQYFDIAYLCNRIEKVLGRKQRDSMSCWGVVKPCEAFIMNKKHTFFEIYGVEVLDYMDLYKKYTYANRESYKLDFIASLELGSQKMDYSEYGSLKNFYKQDYQRFLEYNIHDVELVDQLDGKMKLIDLIMSMAYAAKVNYSDVFSPVRMWDIMILNYLMTDNIVIPFKKGRVDKDEKYAGAFVLDPIIGEHKWVVSFDFASLYPSIIRQWNISPDTIIEENGVYPVTVDSLLSGESDLSKLKERGHTVAVNGQAFSSTKIGFLPKIIEKIFNERVGFKKRMLDAKQKLELVNAEMKARKIK